MRSFRNLSIATGTFAALAAAAVLLSPAPGITAPPTPTTNAVVVNSPDNPVPMVPMGTAAVSVTNTPTVSLASGTSVALDTSGSPILVRSVDDAVREIFQEMVQIDLAVGSFGGNAIIPVPLGKRVVIEHVSASGIDQAGEHLNYQVLTTLVRGGIHVQSQHFLVSAGNGNRFEASQPMRVYGDPDTTIVLAASRARADAVASVVMTVSGYFVDVP